MGESLKRRILSPERTTISDGSPCRCHGAVVERMAKERQPDRRVLRGEAGGSVGGERLATPLAVLDAGRRVSPVRLRRRPRSLPNDGRVQRQRPHRRLFGTGDAAVHRVRSPGTTSQRPRMELRGRSRLQRPGQRGE